MRFRSADLSVTLDDYVGHERVLAVFCDAPFAVEPLRAALAASGDLQPRAGCSVATLDLHKKAPP